MPGRTALLIGATGLVGARCLSHLLATTAYTRIICLVRRPALETQVPERSERLREQVVDFDALRPADVDATDDVFCAIGSTMKKAGSREAFRRIDYDLPLRVIHLAVKAGAKRVVLVSSVGADARSSNFYLKTKGELEDAIATMPLRAFHVFRPGLLLGDRAESRPGEVVGGVVMRVMRGLLVRGLRKYRPIDADQVGRAMVHATLGPDPTPPLIIHHHDEVLALAAASNPIAAG